MDNIETLAPLGTEDTGRRQTTKQNAKTQQNTVIQEILCSKPFRTDFYLSRKRLIRNWI